MNKIEKIVISVVIFFVALHFLGLSLIPFSNGTAVNLLWSIAWLLMYTKYIILWFVGPSLLIVSFLFLLYVKLRHKAVNPRLHRDAKIIFFTSLLIVLYVLVILFLSYVFNHNLGSKKIKEIQNNDFQVYKITKLPPGYKIYIYSTLDDEVGVKVSIYKNNEAWVNIWEKPMAKPNSSADCFGITTKDNRILKSENCYYLTDTSGGLKVFAGRWRGQSPETIKNPYAFLLASKNSTSFELTSSIGHDGIGFSSSDLNDLYQILDSLQPITDAELHHYKQAPLDNLK